MLVPRRKILLGAAGIPALGLSVAQAATPFTTFAFTATGEPAARTMPDRLAEIKNVLDFGADPTGVSDSQPAVQAAVNWTSGANRGTIYFPPGTYQLNSSVTFNYNGGINIRFLGEGSASYITGGFGTLINSYLFDRNNVNSGSPLYVQTNIIFEKLALNCNVSTGCVRVGSANGVAFQDCTFAGQVGISLEDSAGNSSSNYSIDGCEFTGPSGSPSPQNTQNGIIAGGSGVIEGCGFVNCYVAIRAYGSGFHINGVVAENCQFGYLFGIDSGGTDQGASGFSCSSFTTEGDDTGVYLQGTCSGFFIGPGNIQGHPASNSGYPRNVSDSHYGLRLGANCTSGVVMAVTASANALVGCIDIATASARTNVVLSVVNGNQSGSGGQNWSLQYGSPTPTNAYTAIFDRCNITPIWNYSQLPSGGNVLEGDEFNIGDAITSSCSDSACNWGSNVTGGTGALHRLVRWNGSNWTVVAK